VSLLSKDTFVRAVGSRWMKRFFRRIYEYWMAFGLAIGVIVTPIQLFLVYMLVFGPSRLFATVAGKDLLDRRMAARDSFWHPKEPRAHTVDEARHQF
jgi:hypothetical protein